jgi:hypothetical protein
MDQSDRATLLQVAGSSGHQYRSGGTTPTGSNEGGIAHHRWPVEVKLVGCSTSYAASSTDCALVSTG